MHRPQPWAFDAAAAADFLDASANWPPRATLLTALAHLAAQSESGSFAADAAPRAIDLGCGAGTETIELLRRGWAVDAIDGHQSCVDFTQRRAEAAGLADRLKTASCAFEDLSLPPRTSMIAHAGFSIPFCRAASFDRMWREITEAVLPGGCFAGQLFGAREPLILAAAPGSVVSHDAASIRKMLGPNERPWWRVVDLEEIDRLGRGPRGEAKHWHVFHAVFERTRDLPPPDGDGRCGA